MLDDTEMIDEKKRREAFHAEFSWDGNLLEPYSIKRQGLFFDLRFAAGAMPLQSVLSNDLGGFLEDAVRIVYICMLPPQILREARLNLLDFEERAHRWAEENITFAQRTDLALLGLKIHMNSTENQHITAPSQSEAGKSPAPSLSPSTSPSLPSAPDGVEM